jgi:hypothetical protein
LPWSASVVQTAGSSGSKNCPSSIPTTSVSGATFSSSSRELLTLSAWICIALCDVMWPSL